jgi:hypothetical protein
MQWEKKLKMTERKNPRHMVIIIKGVVGERAVQIHLSIHHKCKPPQPKLHRTPPPLKCLVLELGLLCLCVSTSHHTAPQGTVLV